MIKKLIFAALLFASFSASAAFDPTASYATVQNACGQKFYLQGSTFYLPDGTSQGASLPACAGAVTAFPAGVSATTVAASGALTALTFNGNTLTTGSSTFTGTAGQTYTFPAATSTLSAVLSATTGTITPGAILAGVCANGTVAVTGATTAMTVSVSANTYPGDGTLYYGYVSVNGTVTVKVCAVVALTPVASTYNVRVTQ